MPTLPSYQYIGETEYERRLLQTYVNVGTGSTPEWQILGYKVEDSSIELNPSTSTITDILGITHTDVESFEASQGFDPGTILGGNKLQLILTDIYRRGARSEFKQFEVLVVYGWLGEEGAWQADVDKNCTITPSTLGGSSTVDMNFEISFSGEKTLGTVNSLDPYASDFAFTPAASSDSSGG